MIATVAGGLALTGAALPAEPPKVAAGLYQTKELLLMDEDRNGKVSRGEFMKSWRPNSMRWTPTGAGNSMSPN